jgi:hypothetical protein
MGPAVRRCRSLADTYSRGATDVRGGARAYQASLRMIQSGERPVYRAIPLQNGSWSLLGFEWLAVDANDRGSALEASRAAVAAWLGVAADTFESRRRSADWAHSQVQAALEQPVRVPARRRSAQGSMRFCLCCRVAAGLLPGEPRVHAIGARHGDKHHGPKRDHHEHRIRTRGAVGVPGRGVSLPGCPHRLPSACAVLRPPRSGER